MANRLTLVVLMASTVLLFSCGASKKLQTQVDDLQSKNSQLTSQNNQLTSQVSDLKKQANDLSSQNKTIVDQFNSYKSSCEADKVQLKAVNQTLDEFTSNVTELQAKIDSAEQNFKDKGFDVYSKDGIVYVDMQDNLLYKSGSSKLSKDGKEALGNLATVLGDYPKLKVIVVGNTDTMHVKGVADNWSLSTERANGVVRALTNDYNIDPARMTSAGKSKFNPIADNSTADGRAKNRRTEIVLNPDWERLWESVKKE
jgi:chemotaxis protein MotB